MESLRRQGFEVLRLKDFIPTDSSDQLVISTAQKKDAILVSLNGDFMDIVNYPPRKYKGIIALQVRNHPRIISQIIDRLLKYLSENLEPEHYMLSKLIEFASENDDIELFAPDEPGLSFVKDCSAVRGLSFEA